VSAPLLAFLLTAVLALVSLALRRSRAGSFAVAAVGSLIIGVFILAAPIGSARAVLGVPIEFGPGWRILGRMISLSAQSRAPVAFLYLVGAVSFAAGYFAPPGRSFAPLGLITLGLLGGSLTIEPFLYAAIFLELAALASILVLNPPGRGHDPGSLQLLVLYSLAMVAILFTGWLLENVGITSVTPELAGKVRRLLGLGFAILMFVPPFHFWLGRSAERVHSLALGLVAVVLQAAGLFFLLRFLDGLEWLRNEPQVGTALRTIGLLTASFGAVAAAVQASYPKATSYLLVADFGVSLLVLGSALPARLELVLLHLGVRATSLVAWGLGSAIRSAAPGAVASGADRARRTGTLLSLLGAMGLAGLPPTGGFAIRYAMLMAPQAIGPAEASAILGSMLFGLFAVLRWVPSLVAVRPAESPAGQHAPEGWPLTAAVLLCGLLTVLPQLGSVWIAPAAQGLANLRP
jgi:formate hydrogenlyase subunit 3/multisubunit Na+/H+ antiporter MnhD subunit